MIGYAGVNSKVTDCIIRRSFRGIFIRLILQIVRKNRFAKVKHRLNQFLIIMIGMIMSHT